MVQNIRIKYVVDSTDLDKADRSIDKLSASEKQLKQEFDNVNKSAKNSFDSINKGAKESSSGVGNLSSVLKGVGGAVVAAFAVDKLIDFGKQVIEVRAKFEKLEAVLTNTLGDKSMAKVALADITELAAKTNFGVLELTESYVKLANSGFKPTSEEIMNLADLANSTGKSFNQLTEAIIDAQTGEFERLKEFGITASKSGDMVKFTFKGVETQTKFTSGAIQDYILGLGDLQGVSGSTAAISQTLEGRISNLGDSYDQFLNVLGERTAPIIGAVIGMLGSLVEAATDAAKSLDMQIDERNVQNLKNSIGEDKEALDTLVEIYEYAGLKTSEATKRALHDTILNLEMASAALIQNGKDFSSVEYQQYQTRIETLERFQAEFLAKQKKADADELEANAKAAKAAKDLEDKNYREALSRLNEKEKNTLRIAAVEKKDKEDLVEIERSYNVQRVGLFKSYNQTNLEELRGYNIKFQELNKERLDYLRGQEAKYTGIIKAEDNARYEIEKEYLDSVEAAEKAKFDQSIEDQLKLEELDIKAKEKAKKADKELAEQRKETAQALVSGLTDLYNTYNQNQRIATQNQLSENAAARESELAMYDGNKQAQATINAKYDQMDKKLKREQAVRDRDNAIFNIGIGIAQAVVKALASGPPPGNFVLAGIVGGLGAIQLGLVASRPMPKFAKGGFTGLGSERDETGERVAGIVHEEEYVTNKRKTKQFRPFLDAIHNGSVSPDFLNNMVMNYDRIGSQQDIIVHSDTGVARAIDTLARKVDNLKQVNINIDKNGIQGHLETQYSKTEFVNNYITA